MYSVCCALVQCGQYYFFFYFWYVFGYTIYWQNVWCISISAWAQPISLIVHALNAAPEDPLLHSFVVYRFVHLVQKESLFALFHLFFFFLLFCFNTQNPDIFLTWALNTFLFVPCYSDEHFFSVLFFSLLVRAVELKDVQWHQSSSRDKKICAFNLNVMSDFSVNFKNLSFL